ncbi:tetratricopeptide repeat protein [Micromonospora krabiensis]|uniref:Tetratricopeptide repeat-containing protein n=1 Tax=Micromonospora krabiensis TaxID=307121 RepID=A0A1C3N372_9ACTN|nr:tetratricopeptide repeat protein [Micromonospora krabiensis]SBV27034.1 Tetratricopeptide repeat-containing protein [Micromonospora krabiensis]
MPSGFGELTDQAHHLVSLGDLAGAQRLLSDALTDADPSPANAGPELAEAASLQARVLVALGEPHSARGWAAFAYAAATRLHGRSDPRTVSAAATLAAVLYRVGSHSRAARLYQEVIVELTAQEGPESLRVLAAHADLATVEYARGQCQVARDRLQDAWELHREVYGEGHPSGIKMLARLGGMQRDCGQFAEAHDNLALARELARQHLPADDPLALQVAALARAAANPDHVCADTAPDAPAVPAARNPPPDDADPPRVDHPAEAASPSHPPYLHAAGAGEAYPDTDGAGEAYPDTGGTGGSHPDADGAGWAYQDADGTGGTAYRPGVPDHDAPAVPNPRQPVDEPVGAEQAWWPPEPAGGAVPPAVVTLTGAGPAEEADGVHRVRVPDDPDEPYQPSRLLPVPVHRPPAPAGRRLLPFVVGGIVVVLLGAAAVIAGVARVDGDPDPTPSMPAAPSGTATAGDPTGSGSASGPPGPGGSATPTPGTAVATPGTPPSGVDLRDTRDSIVLRWTYPAGGEGPVVISGGRAGQDKSIFADLPPGESSYIVYGLNRTTDYCFTVAVVWSADVVATADEVCTRRR